MPKKQEDHIVLTQEGYDTLSQELADLKVELPKTVKEVESARAAGDLRENAPYHAAREKQSRLQGRIEELEHIIKNAEVHNPEDTRSDVVTMGSVVTITVKDAEKSLKIVGEQEADIGSGKISSTSPLGKALMNREEGDTVTVHISGNDVEYQILEITK